MAILGIEVNDAALAAVGADATLYCEPAVGLLRDGQLLLGSDARLQSRVYPRNVHDEYFAKLSEQPLPHSAPPYLTTADLVHAHLELVQQRAGNGYSDVVLVIPSWWTDGQLSLMLGIADEVGLSIAGLVPAALAATRREYQGQQLFHVELGWSRCSVEELQQGQGTAVASAEQLTDFGYATLENAAAKYVMQRLLECSRFDAMQSGTTEQLIYDRLPDWLSALQRQSSVDIEVEFGDFVFAASLSSAALLEELRRASQPLIRCLRSVVSSSTETPVALQCHSAFDNFPGLAMLLADEIAATPYLLEPAAGARGAMRRAAQLPANNGGFSLVRQLPVDMPALPQPDAPRGLRETLRPTHVVYRDTAYRLQPGTLVIGTALQDGETGILIEEPSVAVSRRHCSIVTSGSGTMLQEHSRFGTLLNSYPLRDSAMIRAGDALSIGQPGIELRFVREFVGSDADGGT